MRRLIAAVMAVPVLASLYLALVLSHRRARRAGIGAAGAVGVMLVALIGIGLASPATSVSLPPSQSSPLPQSQFQPIATYSDASAMARGNGATTPAAGTDATETAGVAAAAAANGVTAPGPRSSTGTGPEAVPVSGGTATTTLAGQAQGRQGVPAGSPAAASVTIRQPTAVKLAPSHLVGNRMALTAGFLIQFDRSVSLAVARKAFTVKPAVKGTLKAVPGSTTRFVFVPAAPLAPGARYTVSFAGNLVDTQGQAIARPAPHAYLTIPSTNVVRFQPALKSTGNDPAAGISVRFSQPMDPTTTARAFSANIAGHKLVGTVTWAENHTVLVFKPAHTLLGGAGVGVRVTVAARSLAGAPLAKGISFTFKVKAKAPTATTTRTTTKPTTGTASKPKPKPSSSSGSPSTGGGSVGGGSWAAVESFYLTLMNCTRTGGWVQSDGSCSSPGGRDVAPLWIDQGISDNVTRPYARLMATRDECSHFADGTPGDRLARAGYHSYQWAENMSCPQSMSPDAAMIYTQQYFQNEKSYNGGHYVNLMNPLYDRVGIGVWVANGLTEVVIDFYHP